MPETADIEPGLTSSRRRRDPASTASVHAVVVNYRTPELCLDAVTSLLDDGLVADGATELERATIDLHVTVVDNASGDESPRQLEEFAAEHPNVEFLSLETNAGFAAGNNAALAPVLASDSPPDYVLLLNPDTIVRPGAIDALVRYLEHHPDVGLVGSRLEDPDGTAQRSAFRFPSLLSEVEHAARFGPLSRLLRRWVVAPPVIDHATETDWVAGASMLVRHRVLADVGPMDSDYFLYFEEVDFCRAARRSGWKCAYEPQSRVVHLVGQASGVTTPHAVRRRPAYWFASRRRYFVKNHGLIYAAATDLAWILAYLTWRLRRRLQRKPDRDPPHFLTDFIRGSVWRRGRPDSSPKGRHDE